MADTPDTALPEELRRAFANGDLIVCLGPAASVEVGLPSLRDLALALVGTAHAADADVDVDALRARVDAGRSAEVLQLTQRSLGAAFVREVQTRLSDRGAEPPPMLRALAARRDRLRAIYTVRMDRLLERALAGHWPSFAEARPDLAQRRGVIFKLLGTLEQPDSWVLTRAQVSEALGAGTPRREAFATAYAAHQMLFVGFAPDDDELSELLDLTPAAEAGSGPGHFIVAADCTPEDRALLTGRGLQVIDAAPIDALHALGEASNEADEPPSVEASPYPGAAPLTEALAPAFFGRHGDVSDAASRLGPRQRWLSVEAPDGVGKTSFVLAGLVPALRRGFSEIAPERWIVASVAAGDEPSVALVDALERALGTDDRQTLADALANSAERFVEWLALHVPPDAALLLIIDPLEDVLAASEAERTTLTTALHLALRREALHLVTTLRSVDAATERRLGTLSEPFTQAVRHRLRRLGRIGLRDAIVEPAALLGVRVEPALAEALIDDASESLTAVALTMAGLWAKAVLADKVVAAAEYRALGGAAGALRRHAERSVQTLPVGERDAAVALLTAIVHRDAKRERSARPLPVDDANDRFGRAVVEALLGAGLVALGGSLGAPVVEPQHVDLLRDWSRLAEAFADEALHSPSTDTEARSQRSSTNEAPVTVPSLVADKQRRFGLGAMAVVGALGVGCAVAVFALADRGETTPPTATPVSAPDPTETKPAGEDDGIERDTPEHALGSSDRAGADTGRAPAGEATETTDAAASTGAPAAEPKTEAKPKPKKPCYVRRADYRKLPTKASRAGMHCEVDRDSRKPLPAGCSRRYVCE